jgi:hypothetical protein
MTPPIRLHDTDGLARVTRGERLDQNHGLLPSLLLPSAPVMKVGLIQTRGIGDIIIALPIADFFLDRGDEVHWPIDEVFVPMFRRVKPDVHFIPIARTATYDYFHDTPLARLRDVGCQRIIPLYSFLRERAVHDQRLTKALKFDEYKYAVAGVPFARKWELRIHRGHEREEHLDRRLNITGPYICVHREGTDRTIDVDLPREWLDQYRLVDVSPMTDSIFDWITTFERAAKLVLLDSCFANLVEQLNIQVEKYFVLRSAIYLTPVLKNGWGLIHGHNG